LEDAKIFMVNRGDEILTLRYQTNEIITDHMKKGRVFIHQTLINYFGRPEIQAVRICSQACFNIYHSEGKECGY